MPHERFQGKTQLGFRGDAIVELDWCVGELMKTVERLNLSEKTLVVFCSDNGPVLDDGYKDGAIEKNGDHRAAGMFSGGKYSVYEGGTRTPFLARWKGKIKPAVSDEIVCTVDLAASVAALVGQPIPDSACLDSFDLHAALLGEPNANGRTHLVQQDNGTRGTFGYRVGEWKLHRHEKKQARNVVVEKQLANTAVPQYQLFRLSDDVGEKKNVIDQHPEIAIKMQTELEEIISAGRSREPNVKK